MARPGWLPYAIGVVAVALFINNGFWQLRRQDQKLRAQAEYDAAAHARLVRNCEELAVPQRVVMRGEWHAAGTVFLDNRSYQGRPGFHVLTPLRLVDAGGAVMVDRGWMAVTDRNRLPAVSTPTGVVEVSGRVVEPVSGGFSLGEAVAEPGIWQRIDPLRFKEQVSGAVAAVYVQQESAAADGLVRDWARPDFGVGKHLGYAFQWFAFAGVTTGLMLWFGWRRHRKSRV